ncbi:VanZ family protein [Corynebacterium epidermidicanis]|uniref:Glycopeptide antibiotics resistance protein n=1 Tax=Corynebacterium epidermidicanis TaxID=1050174 RepID=A0A0G3GXJ9_9CORY|nr:VanZ family protein [Corynebacterium epidermidicanis]AKK04243.1 glycopeptide antibiotics resistance protein [Corynebacterium epidermidicanis]
MRRHTAEPYRDATRSDVLAVVYYVPVLILLTLLKGYFVIGHLWRKDSHHIRELHLVPFREIWGASTWFGPIFNIVGNMVLFVPLGMLAFMLLRSIKHATLLGLATSLVIEVCQYVFALGVTDIDDLLWNTTGALFGAWLVWATGVRVEKLWRWACLLFATVIYVLYLLGPRLGSEEKMTPVACVTCLGTPAVAH